MIGHQKEINFMDSHSIKYCIYIDTFCDGRIPVQRDGEGNPYVYDTELEAQREIAEDAIEHLNQFLAGERDFELALGVEEYVEEVSVFPDGSVIDSSGRYYFQNNW